jgi:hypothetical protein
MYLPSRSAKYLTYLVLGLLAVLLLFALLRSCRPVTRPTDEYGQSTIDTPKEARRAAGQAQRQHNADSILNAIKTKKPTPLTRRNLDRADSILRADLGY